MREHSPILRRIASAQRAGTKAPRHGKLQVPSPVDVAERTAAREGAAFAVEVPAPHLLSAAKPGALPSQRHRVEQEVRERGPGELLSDVRLENTRH